MNEHHNEKYSKLSCESEHAAERLFFRIYVFHLSLQSALFTTGEREENSIFTEKNNLALPLTVIDMTTFIRVV